MRSRPRARRRHARPLRLAAQGARRRRRAQPARAARRHRAQAARDGVALASPRSTCARATRPPSERARMAARPADILITTPESLYLLLTSAARETLASVDTVIVDEIHAARPDQARRAPGAVARAARGAAPRGPPPLQRIGLSATQRPLDEVARLLGGLRRAARRGPSPSSTRAARKELELAVEDGTPTADDAEDRREAQSRARPQLGALWPACTRASSSSCARTARPSSSSTAAAWPSASPRRSTSVARRGDRARPPRLGRAREARRRSRSGSSAATCAAIVATSSLELGHRHGRRRSRRPDRGAAERRLGPAARRAREPRRRRRPARRPLPEAPAAISLACAAAAAGMRAGDGRGDVLPPQPARRARAADRRHRRRWTTIGATRPLRPRPARRAVRRPASRAPSRACSTCCSGRYPSDDVRRAAPAPHVGPRARPRRGPRGRAAPRGHQRRHHPRPRPLRRLRRRRRGRRENGGRRVGELDEEMVFELREGEVFLLGASSWRADEITARPRARVAGGRAARQDALLARRPAGPRARVRGAHRRARPRASRRRRTRGARRARATSTRSTRRAAEAPRRVRARAGRGDRRGPERPRHRRRALRGRDRRLARRRPVPLRHAGPSRPGRIGGRGAPARDVRRRRRCTTPTTGWPSASPRATSRRPPSCFFPSPDEIEAHGDARARRHRALRRALPRVRGARAAPAAPRSRAAHAALGAAQARRRSARGRLAPPDFPIVLETYRECLRDVFDLPGLVGLLRDVRRAAGPRRRRSTRARRRRSRRASSSRSSPTSSTRATRRSPSAARRRWRSTSPACASCSARPSSASCSTPTPSTSTSAAAAPRRDPAPHAGRRPRPAPRPRRPLARRAPRRGALRRSARTRGRASSSRARTRRSRCASPGRAALAAVEDAASCATRSALTLPAGLAAGAPRAGRRHAAARPRRPLRPDARPLRARRTSRRRFGLDAARSSAALAELLARGARSSRARSCRRDASASSATARSSTPSGASRSPSCAAPSSPSTPRALARFLLEWQGVPRARRGRDALLAVVGELEGCPLVASALETEHPARAHRRLPALGPRRALRVRRGRLGRARAARGERRARRALPGRARGRCSTRPVRPVEGPVAAIVRDLLARRGAVFFAEIAREVGGFPGEVLDVALGDGLGRRGHQRHARAAAQPRTGRRRAQPRRSPHPTHPARAAHGPARERGTLVAATSRAGGAPRPATPTGAPRSPGRCSIATASSRARRRTPRAIAGGLRGRLRRAQGARGPGARAARATSSRGAAARSSRCPAPTSGCARFATRDDAAPRRRARGDRPGERLGRAPRVARAEPAATPGPSAPAGALVVLHDGRLLGWLGRGGHPLLTFDRREPTAGARELARALGALVDGGDRRALLVSTIDGVDAPRRAPSPRLRRGRLRATSRGLLKRRAARARGASSVEVAP